MTDFKVKMHLIRFRLGLRPRPSWGSLQRSPRPLAGFGGRFAAGGWAGEQEGKGRGRGGREKLRGGKGRAPILMLNQGPSEPCYATGIYMKHGCLLVYLIVYLFSTALIMHGRGPETLYIFDP